MRLQRRAVGVCEVRYAVKLVPDDTEDEVFPKAVRDAFAEADDPLAARQVQWILPNGPAHARVKEEVVGGGEKGGWRMDVRPEGPE